MLTEEERMEVFRVVGKHMAGKCNLFAHVGAISTDSAIRMAKVAEESGFDAVSAVAPFYYSFPLEAIKTYYSDIMHATSLPMLMYNLSTTTNCLVLSTPRRTYLNWKCSSTYSVN